MLHKYSGAHPPGGERVVLAVRPSPFAPRAIGIAALATLAIVHLVPVDGWVKLSLVLWVGACASRAIGHFTHRRAHSCVVAVITDPSQAVEVRYADGHFAHGTIVDGSFVAPWLTVIHWRPMQSRFARTIPLLPDMVEESAFRRMRVLLRWSAAL